MGGLAVAAHGYVRYTEDVDLVVALEKANVTRALMVLESLGYRPGVPVPAADFADPEKRNTWIRDKGMVVFQMTSDRQQETPIDLFVSEPFDFAKEWERAIRLPAEGGQALAPVVSYEQLLVLKRASGRQSDLIDIEKLEKIHDTASNGWG